MTKDKKPKEDPWDAPGCHSCPAWKGCEDCPDYDGPEVPDGVDDIPHPGDLPPNLCILDPKPQTTKADHLCMHHPDVASLMVPEDDYDDGGDDDEDDEDDEDEEEGDEDEEEEEGDEEEDEEDNEAERIADEIMNRRRKMDD